MFECLKQMAGQTDRRRRVVSHRAIFDVHLHEILASRKRIVGKTGYVFFLAFFFAVFFLAVFFLALAFVVAFFDLVDLVDLPKADSQPLAYLSLDPRRKMVTEFPSC